jgi:hypothetical protein
MSDFNPEGRRLHDTVGSMTPYSEIPIERRVRHRFSTNAPVIVTLGEREIPAFTRDLSNRGVYFYVTSAEGFSIGQKLDLLVKLPPEITLSTLCQIRCQGRLLRMEEASNDLTGIAAEIFQCSILSETETGN